MAVEFKLNGKAVRIEPAPGESLLDSLRERLGTTSVKDGCQPQGQCGCCLALVDGQPKVTCAIAADKAAGKTILTLEGVAAADRDLVATSFAASAAVQCGFCIPGIALRAVHFIEGNPKIGRASCRGR